MQSRVGSTITVFLCLLCCAASAQSLSGDLNGDCRVDFADLAVLSRGWLAEDPNGAGLNHDLHTDLRDLAVLGRHWRQWQCPIVINELLAHSHLLAPDWIELHNVSTAPVDIGGWSLSDDVTNLRAYVIAQNTIVEPNGYIVFSENEHFGNPNDLGALQLFKLSENGETLYLYSGDDPLYPKQLIEQPFGASATGISFGRYLKSTGTYDFPLLSEPTPGAANAYPLVGPIVINEIMYHPAADGDAEYVELFNASYIPVILFDFTSLEPWRFTDDSGIVFSFPTDTPVTLDPQEHLLLVRDAATMRKVYKNIPADVQMFEWGDGKLANSGETLHLLQPGDVDERGIRYWIEVDRVTYSDGSHEENFTQGSDPWPTGTDGQGLSLSRLLPNRYGNDPNNWQATVTTPGSFND
jgi:hypothetical protein